MIAVLLRSSFALQSPPLAQVCNLCLMSTTIKFALIFDFNRKYHTNGPFEGQVKRSEIGINISDSGAIWFGYNFNIEAGFILK